MSCAFFRCVAVVLTRIGNEYLPDAGRQHCPSAFFMGKIAGSSLEVEIVKKRRMLQPMQLTPEEAAQYRKRIAEIAKQAAQNPQDEEVQLREQYQRFTLSHGLGRAVYASYSDEELMQILCWTADELGHVPAQHDVFFLYRIYLKARFRTWPAALRAVGMRQLPAADLELPDWETMLTEEPEICAALLDVANLRETMGYPPRKKDVPHAKDLCERFRSWENTIAASDAYCRWKTAEESKSDIEK